MNSVKLQDIDHFKPRLSRRRRWPKLLALSAIFVVLLFLYLNLSEPPLPPSGSRAKGVHTIFSLYGWRRQHLDSPNAVAADRHGNIYVADTGNHRVAVYDRGGDFRFAIGKKAANPVDQLKKGPLLFPTGVAVSPTGDIYVASMQRSQIFVFDKNGQYLKAIPVDRPISLHSGRDRLFATTPGAIWVFSFNGDLISRWGTKGRNLGSFSYPNGLATDKGGNLFVSDTQNSRIQIFGPDGKLIGWKGTPPRDLNDAQRLFGLNMGLALDDLDRVYVVDAFRHSIHVFDHEGNQLGEFGEQGELDGRFNYPSGLAYLGGDRFAVADKWNDRVQVISMVVAAPPIQVVAGRPQVLYPYGLLFLLVILMIFLARRQRQLVLPAA